LSDESEPSLVDFSGNQLVRDSLAIPRRPEGFFLGIEAIMRSRFVALIPARGGSKGVLRKNSQLIGDSTLVHLAAASAFGAGIVDVYLSSDSQEIQESLSKAFPKIKVIERSEYSASDTAKASDVVFDFLEKVPELSKETFIVYLQPTSPFRQAGHVAEAMSMLGPTGPQSLVSVVEASPNPLKSVSVIDGEIRTFSFSRPTENRQDLPVAFFPNGAIYIFSLEAFLEAGDVPIEGSVPFVMDKISSLDIDTNHDLQLARLLWNNDEF
jgi:CMP-N-acetylneuraminic acid synthetase